MTTEVHLSKKSQDFLENLRVYLFSSGKHEDEIEEIVNELEVHLLEAEKNGKPIEKIIGQSPKEYMEMISSEMSVDYPTWIKYIFIIIIGSFAFKIFNDLLDGNLSYSILEIVGHIVVGAIFIIAIFTGFKKVSTDQSSKKQGIILAGIAFVPMALFVGLIYLNRVIDTPVIHFGNVGSIIIGVLTALFIIGVSIWARSWVMIMIIALTTLPNYLLSFTPLQYETQFILGMILTLSGIGLYLWGVFKLENK